MQKVFIKPIDKYASYFQTIVYINFILLGIGYIINNNLKKKNIYIYIIFYIIIINQKKCFIIFINIYFYYRYS